MLDSVGEFDLVVSIDVLEHIIEQYQALQNLARALRPGGHAFFHVPTVREKPVPFSGGLKEFRAWGEREHVAEELSADQFSARVAASGIEVLRSERTFGYFTGELATSLFALPYRNTLLNVIMQLIVAVPGRLLAMADSIGLEKTRYAVGIVGFRR